MLRHGIWWFVGEMLDGTLRSLSSWSEDLHVTLYDMVACRSGVRCHLKIIVFMEQLGNNGNLFRATGRLLYKEAFG